MLRILAVAEKPSIARILSSSLSKNKYTVLQSPKPIPTLSFPYSFQGQAAQVTVTSVSGSIKDFSIEAKYSFWSLHTLPLLFSEASIREKAVNKEINLNLTRLSRENDLLFLWLDCDREGESIAHDVREICLEGNPRMAVFRARFSALSDKELAYSFETPQSLDRNLYDCVKVRKEYDLRTGAILTRYQTIVLARNKVVPFRQLVSYGPCQLPTLALVVDRWDDIQKHVEHPYWRISAKIVNPLESFDDIPTTQQLNTSTAQHLNTSETLNSSTSPKTLPLTWKRGRLFNKEVVEALAAPLLSNPYARILSTKSTSKKLSRPTPLTTVAFQKLASSKLGMRSAFALSVAERLYSQGYLSYPRTDTSIYPSSFDFESIVLNLSTSPSLGQFCRQLLSSPGGVARPLSGGRDDGAHPPIHPLRDYDGPAGSPESRVFDLVARHFLAGCAADARVAVESAEAEISGEKFSVSQTRIVSKGFLEVYARFGGPAVTGDSPLRAGQVYRVQTSIEPGRTTPPPALAESELIGQMYALGIGTDATISEHVEKILARKFAVLSGGRLTPSALGVGLVKAHQALGSSLVRPLKRAESESLLEEVARGNVRAEEALAKLMGDFKENFDTLLANEARWLEAFREFIPGVEPSRGPGVEPLRGPGVGASLEFPCEKCPQPMIPRKSEKKGLVFFGCKGFPSCSEVLYFPSRPTSMDPSDRLCPLCSSAMIAIHKGGKSKKNELCTSETCLNSFRNSLVRPKDPEGGSAAAKRDAKTKAKKGAKKAESEQGSSAKAAEGPLASQSPEQPERKAKGSPKGAKPKPGPKKVPKVAKKAAAVQRAPRVAKKAAAGPESPAVEGAAAPAGARPVRKRRIADVESPKGRSSPR